MSKRHEEGFTVVELLVVIAIIGILVAMLVPAVQAAREAGRRAQCQNNLKQIGMGFAQHLEKFGHYPTGGWGWQWAGDPDRGYGHRQPGGWAYNILPFVEQDMLHELGATEPDAEKRISGAQAASTPVAIYYCPSRRPTNVYSYTHSTPYHNIDLAAGEMIARTDYAACAGDQVPEDPAGTTEDPEDLIAGGPETLEEGDDPSYDWGNVTNDSNGISYLRSEVKAAQIFDGISNTYMVGEKYLNPTDYNTGREEEYGDNQGWNLGYDYDTHRWTHKDLPPLHDTREISDHQRFGSNHAAGFYAVFCDGSIHMMVFKIDPEVHHWLGVRNDKNPIDQSILR